MDDQSDRTIPHFTSSSSLLPFLHSIIIPRIKTSLSPWQIFSPFVITHALFVQLSKSRPTPGLTSDSYQFQDQPTLHRHSPFIHRHNCKISVHRSIRQVPFNSQISTLKPSHTLLSLAYFPPYPSVFHTHTTARTHPLHIIQCSSLLYWHFCPSYLSL